MCVHSLQTAYGLAKKYKQTQHLSTLLIGAPPPHSPPGESNELNMLCEADHTQTAAIKCLPKTLEHRGGQSVARANKVVVFKSLR